MLDLLTSPKRSMSGEDRTSIRARYLPFAPNQVFHINSVLTLADRQTTIQVPMLVYLCGSIEYSPDHGKAWRAEITPFLVEHGHEVYDPALDEKKDLTDEELKDFRGWKTQDLARFQRTIRKIIRYDLDIIEQRANCIVAYWDEYAGRGAGTQGELTVAHRRGIPIYLVAAIPVTQVSGWLLGCASEVFTDFADLKQFLAAKHGNEKTGVVCAAR